METHPKVLGCELKNKILHSVSSPFALSEWVLEFDLCGIIWSVWVVRKRKLSLFLGTCNNDKSIPKNNSLSFIKFIYENHIYWPPWIALEKVMMGHYLEFLLSFWWKFSHGAVGVGGVQDFHPVAEKGQQYKSGQGPFWSIIRNCWILAIPVMEAACLGSSSI